MSLAVDSWTGGGSRPLGHRQPAPALHWRELLELATELSTVEGFVPKALLRRPSAILATLLAGQELGLPPMESLRAIYIIEGRASLSAEVARALVYAAGHELRCEATDQRATARGKRHGDREETVIEWDMPRARQAKLADRPNWRLYPRQMLSARATSELCHLVFSDTLAGLDVVVPEDLDQTPIGTLEDAGADTAKPKTRASRAKGVVTAPPLEPAVTGEAAVVTGEAPDGATVGGAPPDAPEPPPPVSAVTLLGRQPEPDDSPPEPDGPDPGIPENRNVPPLPPLPGEPVNVNQGAMLRRLHARMTETFPGVPRETMDDYRHAIVAVVTRQRGEGPVASSALLSVDEQMGFEAMLNHIAAGRCVITHTARGTIELTQGGWLYEVEFDPLTVTSTPPGRP